jgi:hypothetical protein
MLLQNTMRKINCWDEGRFDKLRTGFDWLSPNGERCAELA